MIDYLKGKLVEKSPAHAVIECNGVGYHVNISVHTFGLMSNDELCKLFIEFIVREDAQILYGFANKDERQLFRNLISVSGVGPNTARVILSSYKPSDIQTAILNENVDILKSIKGIGAKTAQRVIIDLKDKIAREEPQLEISSIAGNTLRDEALSALVALGFERNKAIKVLQKVLVGQEALSVEQVIKSALKQL
ncbi:MAG: Holliday junction branch migration protein RuvA [Flavobacteriales bacterium]|nr:Holliday junction branch migration protein RuvA [Flavobacteriales bacterium]